ncbi:MAG: DegV family protein [Lachnospiraceae bacterium]|nr:DegV family protein [Lachnospiraceae bacterium]
MKKIAILTDSNSGITQSEAKEMGIHVIPMPFTINNDTYYEGINLSQEQFYEFLAAEATVSTSQPSPDTLIVMFKKLLKEYDEVVHIPMSSGLSGSYQTARMISQEDDFAGKVFVVNNQRISVTQKQAAFDALALSKKGYDAIQIRDILEEDKFNCSIYIMLDTLYYLKKGGRITPAAAALGTLLRLKPVLQIQGEKLDAYAKARTSNQGKTIMMQAIRKDIETRFGGWDAKTPDRVFLQVAHSNNEAGAMAFRVEIEKEFPGLEIRYVEPLSLSISCHTGPGALGIAVTQKLEQTK